MATYLLEQYPNPTLKKWARGSRHNWQPSESNRTLPGVATVRWMMYYSKIIPLNWQTMRYGMMPVGARMAPDNYNLDFLKYSWGWQGLISDSWNLKGDYPVYSAGTTIPESFEAGKNITFQGCGNVPTGQRSRLDSLGAEACEENPLNQYCETQECEKGLYGQHRSESNQCFPYFHIFFFLEKNHI